jgi:hypothetical protein
VHIGADSIRAAQYIASGKGIRIGLLFSSQFALKVGIFNDNFLKLDVAIHPLYYDNTEALYIIFAPDCV